ncbi:Mn2+/Fe2+ transporter (plasmid) [Natrialba magadii ATCC 43099]|uniref:Mn2+/Fe2+ transporter n=1 Tax=Natrialba magadii (strain ATCC 43099 / DSM 3394 / CCM 3739 / CIP 104546 / IAM 13178 / JCM 8861 / NBRC 102185 / NCIMB 2190 / MS3) TaxID=547559 RepID=D3T0X9_NATMM|nr:hypothetical protein [Natrialba magadii]ADD07238.1 Mn2+/Fe2+ transporter [Natrialba magadii ATCC 43099]ELY34349.1 Mn2+/Fe2+ transporter [Natrialba magadii ATCC 43099]
MAAQRDRGQGRERERTVLLSNPPVKNALVIFGLLAGSTFVGVWAAVEVTNSLGTAATWLWLGIGLSVVYLLNDIANGVKDLVD